MIFYQILNSLVLCLELSHVYHDLFNIYYQYYIFNRYLMVYKKDLIYFLLKKKK